MFNFKRNQIIITVLVFMIAIAAYLNTKELPNGNTPTISGNNMEVANNDSEEIDFFEEYEDIETLPPDGISYDGIEIADNQGINDDEAYQGDMLAQDAASRNMQTIQAVITKKGEDIANNEDDETLKVDKNLDVGYFAEEKMLREQSRAAQIDQLTQYVANENIDKESKAKAAENLLIIQERIEKENSAEALLRAKGFKEVYVRMDDNAVDVVVNKADLTDEEIAQIEEIVHRKTGYSIGKIRITPLKGSLQTEKN